VFGGLNRHLAAALVVGAVFAAPTTAAASGCNGNPSAVNVYKECLPTGGGGKSSAGSSKPRQGAQTGSASTTPVSAAARSAIRHAAKKDRRVLSGLIDGNHPAPLVSSSPSTPVSEPSAVGSAFDLGSGPTALLIALAGTAFLILAGSGLRVWRHRHRL
jgi:hypothetical protein